MDEQFVTFYLDERLFGLNINLVGEINRNIDITTVQLSPGFVRGLINLRGQIVTILDFAGCLGLGAHTVTKKSRCIILKSSAEYYQNNAVVQGESSSREMIGFVVDEIGDIVQADKTMMAKPPANVGEVDGRFLSAVIKLDNDLVAVLDISQVLKQETGEHV